ncbi:protein of unknown function [Microbulbifer donghaiensis]|uniref:Glucose-1-phosphate thymidylyltransferase n=1 Tax=Microbulbifer donghaiensis TaxID=494016 RepID=A0A1M4XBQ3_9GAMM|nr:DUF4389 domain-containing protein [Microbulbifer donghaiensis]SHE90726.1 protein of unknown function [Microbulbifer donghaiensis]
MDNEDLKHNLTSGNQWLRLVYMVLFAFLLEIAGLVMLAVVILQFLFSIITGSANDNLRRLGDQIASYYYQTLQFLVYNTEEKPFPFAEWPESDVEDLSGYESAEEVDAEVVSEEEEAEETIVLGSDEGERESAAPKEEAAEKPAAKKKSTASRKSTATKKAKTGEEAEDSGDKE